MIVADSWCPYNCDPEAENPGFIVEIAQKAFEKHDINVEYSILPWTRAIEETRAGKHTAIIGAYRNDAPDFIFPKIHQGVSKNRFFVKKGNTWRYQDMASLEKISVGAIIGYSYTDFMDAYIDKYKDDIARVQLISGDKALDINIKKLLLGRVGTVIENVDVMALHLKQINKVDEVEPAGEILRDHHELYVAFSPKNPNAQRYATILSDETKAMHASGELKQIMSKYGLDAFPLDE